MQQLRPFIDDKCEKISKPQSSSEINRNEISAHPLLQPRRSANGGFIDACIIHGSTNSRSRDNHTAELRTPI
jgi:hypothetical protein